MKTHYEVLKVDPNAPQELIAESARALLQLLQPRQNASETARQEYLDVARAYKVLSDPLLRAAYDADLHSQPASNANPAPQPEPVVRSAQSKPAYAAQDNSEPSELMPGYGIGLSSLNRVRKGEASLAKTFWYYTLLIPIVFWLALLFVVTPDISALVVCGYSLFYSLPAVWRSSRHSSISPFWRRTTKTVTLLLVVYFILTALFSMVYTSAQRSVSKNSPFTSGDVVKENRIDLASAVLDKDQSPTSKKTQKTAINNVTITPQLLTPSDGIEAAVNWISEDGVAVLSISNHSDSWRVTSVTFVLFDSEQHVDNLNGHRTQPAYTEKYTVNVSVPPKTAERVEALTHWNPKTLFIVSTSAYGHPFVDEAR